MMKLSLIYFGLYLSLNLLIYQTYAQTFTCNSLDGYDTLDLTSATQWLVTSSYQCLDNPAAVCSYYVSFCQPAPMCFNEYSACENSSISSNMTIIGRFSPTIFHENESGPKGFYVQFPAGPMQNISNTTTCEPSFRVNFNCNLKANWHQLVTNTTSLTPEPLDIDSDPTNPCLTIMTFEYAGACYRGKEPEKPNEIGGGAIFLIIVFSVALAYFLFGSIYNGFIRHKSGINIVPNAQFWIGLPLFAIEGCRATLGICSGSSQASRATYESV